MTTTTVQTTDEPHDATATAPPTPQHAAFVEAQERLLRHYGLHARSRYLQLERPTLRAHLLETGHGEPALILHGGDGQGVDWTPLLVHLQDDLRLYALDRPGFGLSDPFDYRRVDLRSHAADFVSSSLDALEIERAVLIGGSMGGFFALATALAKPERVRALVLVGMPVGLMREAPLPLRILCGVPGVARLVIRPTIEARKKQYEKMFHTDPASLPEAYFAMQLAGMRIPGALPTWARLLRRIAGLGGIRPEVDLVDELPQLEVPTLLLWGEHDMAPAEAGRAASERMPQARFVELPGIGHFPFLEAPSDVAERIRKFLSEEA